MVERPGLPGEASGSAPDGITRALWKQRSEQQLAHPSGGCCHGGAPAKRYSQRFKSDHHLGCLRIFGSRDTVLSTGNSGLLRCLFGGSRKVRAAPPIPLGDLRIVRTRKHSLRSSAGRAATASRTPSGVVLWCPGSRHRQIVVAFGWAGELPGGNRTRLTAVSRTHL